MIASGIAENANMQNYRKARTMDRFCDRCGVKLSKENNKQGFNLCDKCNEELVKKYEKVCCNCRHNIRKGEITNIECYCEIDNHHIGYVSCFTHKCRRWAKGEKQ